MASLRFERDSASVAYVGVVHRWDVFTTDLEPVVGREQAGEKRPVVVISNDGFNRVFDVVTVLPITKGEGKTRKVYPFEVQLPPGTIGEGLTSIVMPQQIRTLSKLRLLERIGSIDDPAHQEEIENRVLEHLGIQFEPDLED